MTEAQLKIIYFGCSVLALLVLVWWLEEDNYRKGK